MTSGKYKHNFSVYSVRVFDETGNPQRLKQFANFTSITSIQLFGPYLWFRTVTNQIAAADFNDWTIGKAYIGDIPVEDAQAGLLLPYSQLFIDYIGNLLASQYKYNDVDGSDADRVKFSIRNLDTDRVLVVVKLKDWSHCSSVVTLHSKVFLLCQAKNKSSAILAFDYLN
jgi:hypothetical protein